MTRLFIKLFVLTILSSCNQTRTAQVSNKSELTDSVDSKSGIEIVRQDLSDDCFDCGEIHFNSNNARADSLVKFMNRAKASNHTDQQIWEQRFFCAFPNNFQQMQDIFGYDDSKGAAPLYEYPIGENVIDFFSNLTSVPDNEYFKKYVDININGVWQADNIRQAFNFHKRLTSDTESVSLILTNYTDSEIKSVFRFIFDGPHPKNNKNEKTFNELKLRLGRHNQRLAILLTESYNQLLKEDDEHGH